MNDSSISVVCLTFTVRVDRSVVLRPQDASLYCPGGLFEKQELMRLHCEAT